MQKPLLDRQYIILTADFTFPKSIYRDDFFESMDKIVLYYNEWLEKKQKENEEMLNAFKVSDNSYFYISYDEDDKVRVYYKTLKVEKKKNSGIYITGKAITHDATRIMNGKIYDSEIYDPMLILKNYQISL